MEMTMSDLHIIQNGDYGSVRIVYSGDSLEVQKLVNKPEWVVARKFHVISENYAYHNAHEYARELFNKEFADILV
jgi:acylphosphatase